MRVATGNSGRFQMSRVAWRDLRRRRIILAVVFLTYLPGVLAIMFTVVPVFSWLAGAKPDYFFYAIAACCRIFRVPGVATRSSQSGGLTIPLPGSACIAAYR